MQMGPWGCGLGPGAPCRGTPRDEGAGVGALGGGGALARDAHRGGALRSARRARTRVPREPAGRQGGIRGRGNHGATAGEATGQGGLTARPAQTPLWAGAKCNARVRETKRAVRVLAEATTGENQATDAARALQRDPRPAAPPTKSLSWPPGHRRRPPTEQAPPPPPSRETRRARARARRLAGLSVGRASRAGVSASVSGHFVGAARGKRNATQRTVVLRRWLGRAH